jgi:tRNA threonylcarbamoyladenosine biosynthesis protein TsaB
MLTLLIETSTERGIVAILEHTTVLYNAELPFGYNNSKFLLPMLEQGLKHANLSLSQIALIAVGIGPGSYTGIRIGVVVAKTVAFARKLPLVGVCSLEGFIPKCDGPFAAVIDAKIGGLYLLKGNKRGDCVEYHSQPEVCELEKAGEHLSDVKVLVTPCANRIKPLLETCYPEGRWEWQEREPCAEQLAKAVLNKFNRGEASYDAHLDILYLRKTQAEIEKGK